MAEAAGFVLKGNEMPGSLIRAIAFFAEKAWRILPLSGAPPITRFGANTLSRECSLSDAKARDDMNYRPPFTREQGLLALAAAG
jgi:2-alkyl-3-oxoalkanoate reductase